MRRSRAGFFLSVLVLTIASLAGAQDFPRKEVDLDIFVQELFAVQDEDIDYEDLYELLFQYYRSPINLNTATRDELAGLYLLTEGQINSFFQYKRLNGDLLSIYEIQAVPLWDMATINRVIPFITVRLPSATDAQSLVSRLKRPTEHYLLLRHDRVLQRQRGYTALETPEDNRYVGDPGRLYARYRYARYKDYQIGFTLEKDPGEPFFQSISTPSDGVDPISEYRSFDYISAHLYLQERWKFKRVIIGDYQLQFGQGLVFSSGFGIGKGGEAVATVRRSAMGLRPYTSVQETNFLRGGAATFEVMKGIEVTGFYSNKQVDGTIGLNGTEDEEGDIVSSLQLTGLHRTPAELARRNSVGQQDFGGNLTLRALKNKLELSVNSLSTQYDRNIRREDRVYNTFFFSGTGNHVGSIALNYIWQNFNFFGEAARSQNGGTGVVAGFLSSINTRFDLAMLYRDYSKDFQSLYSATFGERSTNQNERGVYWGLKYRPNRKWTFNMYYDRFSNGWLQYLVDAPTDGYEYLFRANYQPAKRVLLFAQFREETKGRNQRNNVAPIDFVTPTRRRNYILNMDLTASDILSMKSRVQFSDYTQSGGGTTVGMAIVQDVTLDLKQLEITARYALFETDDFDNRQYVYERDLLYVFSFPAYFGRGVRYFILVKWKVCRQFDLWVKYAEFRYRDQKTVGSGLEQIQGPVKSEVRVQARYKF